LKTTNYNKLLGCGRCPHWCFGIIKLSETREALREQEHQPQVTLPVFIDSASPVSE